SDGDTSSIAALLADKGADGFISLREAILATNATTNLAAGADEIWFSISTADAGYVDPDATPNNGDEYWSIAVSSALPTISQAVRIDGSTQSGFTLRPVIELDGSAAGASVNGLLLNSTGDNSEIRSLVINSFSGNGIDLGQADDVIVAGNYIGLDASGTVAAANGATGITMAFAYRTVVGGDTALDRNVIAGNTSYGIVAGYDTVIQGNYIGATADGQSLLNNGGQGIYTFRTGVTIGGSTVGESNVVADGILLNGDHHQVLGNYLGLSSDGTTSIARSLGTFLTIQAGTGSKIGSGTTGEGNLFAVNSSNSIYLHAASSSVSIQGNQFGLAADGVTQVGTSANGVFVAGSTGVDTGHVIGGVNPGEGNTIRGLGIGVRVQDGDGVSILGNSIDGSSGLAIDIGNAGVTLNDSGDGDTGANNLQNFPVLTNALAAGSTFTVSGSLNTEANKTYRIEFFASASADGSGYGEGERYLGYTTVLTDGSGDASFHASLLASVSAGEFISATATEDLSGGSYGGTSEFALSIAAANGPGILVVDTTSDVSDGDTSSIAALLADKGADGFISLREAILATTNLAAGADEIWFSISTADAGYVDPDATPDNGDEYWVIAPASALPTMTDVVVLDATTQAGWSGTPIILLDGSGAGAGVNGLQLSGGNSTVSGFAIGGFGGSGIRITTNGGNTLQSNFIGTNITGTTAFANATGITIQGGGVNQQIHNNIIGGTGANEGNLISGNTGNGIYLNWTTTNTIVGNLIGVDVTGQSAIGNVYGIRTEDSSSNTIGGTAAGSRNTVSGNTTAGISLGASGSNTVVGNFIGTNIDGDAAVANGIGLNVGSSNNIIGGTTTAERNIISGNTSRGIQIAGNGVTGNQIQGNYIGLNAAGDAAVGNTGYGIWLGSNSNTNTIGGSVTGAGNVISGNASHAIYIDTSTSNIIQGNSIGTNAAGSATIANNGAGVFVAVTGSGTRIGGTQAGEGNTIVDATGDGVYVGNVNNLNVSILGNSIKSSSDLGIDLGNNGVNANDFGDPDAGANNGQNFPVITDATSYSGNTAIAGSLNSNASATYRIEFFSAATGDASGHGEAETYLGYTTVFTDGSGNASFHVSLTGVTVTNGYIVTATATVDTGGGSYGATSEFSLNHVVNVNSAPQFSGLDGVASFTEGGPATVLDGNVEITDLEQDGFNAVNGNYSGAILTIVRNGGANSEDVLSFNDGNGITLSGGNLIKNSQIIATFDTTSTPGELVITLTDANGEIPTSADVDAILQQITYSNSNTAPPASVQLDWTFSDGNTGSQGSGGALQTSGSSTVNITPLMTVSGVVYQSDATTALTGRTVRLAVNGVDSGQTVISEAVTGHYEFILTGYTNTDILTVYLEDELEDAVAIARYDALDDLVGIDVVQNRVTAYDDSFASIDNSQLAAAIVVDDDVTNLLTATGVDVDLATTLFVDGNLSISGGTLQTAKDAVGDITISGDLTVATDGTIVVRRSSTVGEGLGQTITATNITIDGVIHADGEGFDATKGPGAQTTRGGTYGGVGGESAMSTYGSMVDPTALGSGGYSGSGGGAIVISATGTVTVDGRISADGSTGSAYRGAGGSVNISTDTLAGSGIIRANGGDSTTNHASGGGGRVSLGSVTTDTFSGTLQANGGLDGNETNSRGRAGTIYLSADRRANLKIGGAGNLQSLRLGSDGTNDYTLGNVTIVSGGVLEIDGNPSMNSGEGGAATLNITSLDVQSGGSISATGFGFDATRGPGAQTTRGGTYGSGGGGDNSTATYGSITDPISLGSGGYSGSAGGAIIISASGAINIDGTVTADGTDGTAYRGSGGSINLSANTLTGSGAIHANGGTSSTNHASGSGGRVSLGGVTTSSFTGMLEADGGLNTSETISRGRTGTIWLTADARANLVLGGVGNLQSLRLGTDGTNDYTFGTITIQSGGVLEIDGYQQINSGEGSAATFNLTSLDIQAGGVFTATGLGFASADGPGMQTSKGGTYGSVGGGDNSSATYGSITNPVSLGSGGYSGAGGGAIIINASGNVTVDGELSAGGQDGGTYRGAGGSINVTAAFLTGSGTISANGGSSSTNHASGSGGRISLNNVVTDTFDGTLEANGGATVAESFYVGRTGTIWLSADRRANLTIGGAGNLQTLRLGSDDSSNYVLGNVTIASGGLLEVDGNQRMNAGLGGAATIVLTALDVQSGGVLSADGLGFQAARGPGMQTNKAGTYGGLGGNLNSSATYGSMADPTSLGSGGYTGAGGGAVIIQATGTITVDGRISADGSTGSTYRGAGGSVNLSAPTLTGSGIIRANGGDSTNNLGSGGGGRISMGTVIADSFDGILQANGGAALAESTSLGRTGTIYLSADRRANLVIGGVGNLQSLRFGSDGTNDYDLGNVTIASGGLLEIDGNHRMNSGLGGAATLNLTTLDVQAGGVLSADGFGFAINQGPGAQTNKGATYGGSGGNNSAAPYGSFITPTSLGSGATYGAGGGAILVTATGGVNVDGTVSADGTTGIHYRGSGGSVLITSDTLTGSGSIHADGGDSTTNLYAGSGGRVAVHLSSGTDFGSVALSAFGGNSTAYAGAAGTVYLRDASQLIDGGVLIVDNDNQTTQAGTDTSIFATLPDDTVGSIVIRNGGKLTLESGTTFFVSGTGQTLDVDATSTLTNLGDLTLGGTSFNVAGTVSFATVGTSVRYIGQPDDSQVLLIGTTYDQLEIDNTGTTFQQSTDITVNGDLMLTAGTLLGASGNLVLFGNLLAAAGQYAGTTSATFILSGTNQSISGSHTFGRLRKTTTVADTLTFQAGSTQSVISGGELTLNGTSGQLLTLQSDTPGTEWNLNIHVAASQSVSSVTVSDSNAAAGAEILASDGTNIDGGNNTNWRFTNSISGTVFEDIDGNVLTGTEVLGDVDNPTLAGVTVLIYSDGGDGLADGVDDTFVSSTVTNASGNYSFSVIDGTYWVVVDSKTIISGTVLSGGHVDAETWAEQTYGVAGALTNGTVVSAVSGGNYGGRNASISDDATTLATSEHVTRVTTTAADVASLDSGFSFNVVTATRDGDDDGSNPRSVQGSLRQFIQNSNALSGGNTMRFVPAGATNDSGSGGDWWTVTLTAALPNVTDAATVIDGTAYDATDGVTLVDPNFGTIGTGGTVGVDGLTLDLIKRPELAINMSAVTTAVGLRIDAAGAALKNLAVWGNGSLYQSGFWVPTA
ncbi:MAG: hypothetical protein KDA85_10640, partial [Planctomycetaceae bacterium]|nr:hypothetical protein [Planctomycetaceae bacterium]